MARIRTVKPKFWDDSKLAKISRDARLIFIGMWNFSDDLGVINGSSVWLKSKIFPYDNLQASVFEKFLLELVKHGFIISFSYEDENFYYLPNLTKHQVINRPNYEDVFIREENLKKALEQSRSNHGLINEQSSQGGERKGKDRKGGESIAPHTFQDSIYSDKSVLKEKLIGTQYEDANVEYYHEVIKNWAESKNVKKINWLATAKNWMASDIKDGKFINNGYKPGINGNSKKWQPQPTGGQVDTASVFNAIDQHYAKNGTP